MKRFQSRRQKTRIPAPEDRAPPGEDARMSDVPAQPCVCVPAEGREMASRPKAAQGPAPAYPPLPGLFRPDAEQTEIEAVFCLIALGGIVLWWGLFHFGMRNVSGRILGLPAWFFYCVPLGFLLLVLGLGVLVRVVFQNPPDWGRPGNGPGS